MREQDPFGMGMVNGEVKTLTQEEYEKAVAERDADEQDDESDDLSDLDELEELEELANVP